MSLSDQSSPDPTLRLIALWRAIRLGPTVDRLRHHVLEAGEHRIDLNQFRILDAVAAHGPCPVRELARVLGVEPSTVTRSTNRLEGIGWLAKRRGDTDGREVLVGLSPEGAQLHRFFVTRALALYGDVLSAFSDEERSTLSNLLERLLSSTERSLALTSPPGETDA